jgi:hypothetical protein
LGPLQPRLPYNLEKDKKIFKIEGSAMTRRWHFGVIALIINFLWSFLIPGFAQEKPEFLVQEKSSQTKKAPPFVIMSRENPAYSVFHVIAKMPPD